jgi:tRNA isopentenyl-2-thiomethyl-A-37 hydroxylase MiaE
MPIITKAERRRNRIWLKAHQLAELIAGDMPINLIDRAHEERQINRLIDRLDAIRKED